MGRCHSGTCNLSSHKAARRSASTKSSRPAWTEVHSETLTRKERKKKNKRPTFCQARSLGTGRSNLTYTKLSIHWNCYFSPRLHVFLLHLTGFSTDLRDLMRLLFKKSQLLSGFFTVFYNSSLDLFPGSFTEQALMHETSSWRPESQH